VEAYISAKAGMDLSLVFDQYLRTVNIPVLEYRIKKGQLYYRWTNCVDGFNMPVKIMVSKDQYAFIYPSKNLAQIKFLPNQLTVDKSFYVNTHEIP
jgi:hypothetical protein